MSGRLVAVVGIGCAGLLVLGGCGKKVVSKDTVELQVAHQLATQVHQPTPKVVCPDDIDAKVGATMTCVLTPQGDTTTYNVEVKVSSVSNGTAHFNIQVASTPNPSTSP